MAPSPTQPAIGFREYARFLARYMKPRMHLVLALGVTLFINIGLMLVNPQILRSFIDLAMAGGAQPALTRMALTFIGVAVLQQLIGVLVVYVTENLGWATTNDLRLDLARYCLGLDMSFHTSHTPGEMIERIDGDVMALSNFFSQFILQVFGNMLLVVGILMVLLLEDWRVSPLADPVRGHDRGRAAAPGQHSRQQLGRGTPSPAPTCTGSWKSGSPAPKISAPTTPVNYVLDRFYRLTRTLMRKTIQAGLKLNILLNTTWTLFAVGNAVAFPDLRGAVPFQHNHPRHRLYDHLLHQHAQLAAGAHHPADAGSAASRRQPDPHHGHPAHPGQDPGRARIPAARSARASPWPAGGRASKT